MCLQQLSSLHPSFPPFIDFTLAPWGAKPLSRFTGSPGEPVTDRQAAPRRPDSACCGARATCARRAHRPRRNTPGPAPRPSRPFPRSTSPETLSTRLFLPYSWFPRASVRLLQPVATMPFVFVQLPARTLRGPQESPRNPHRTVAPPCVSDSCPLERQKLYDSPTPPQKLSLLPVASRTSSSIIIE